METGAKVSLKRDYLGKFLLPVFGPVQTPFLPPSLCSCAKPRSCCGLIKSPHSLLSSPAQPETPKKTVLSWWWWWCWGGGGQRLRLPPRPSILCLLVSLQEELAQPAARTHLDVGWRSRRSWCGPCPPRSSRCSSTPCV